MTALIKYTFLKLGVLPFLLIIAMVTFTLLSGNFLTVDNLLNVARQSTYLMLVAMGQMLALLSGGFDLSVGVIIALTSVVAAMVMSWTNQLWPEQPVLAITFGILAGLATGAIVGMINGLGVAYGRVSPFMMTLGMSSVGFGAALYLTGGAPVYGMPEIFSDVFGFGRVFGVPTPVLMTAVIAITMWFFLNHTVGGRYLYAVGGNEKAAKLSGINTQLVLFNTYVLCALMAAISGLLLTARLETGEANIGAALPLESIAACVIAGVSLRGGVGRLASVVMGALFIGLIQNGMNLAHVESYLQTVVIGCLLIIAVLADQFRQKLGN